MTVTTRAASAQLASAKMAQLNINTENTDQGMPVGKVGQRPHTAHPSQRNALGDIGNKVTGNKLGDGSKKAPIKKEIVQREIVQLVNTRQTRNISKKASKPTDVDEHLLTQESTAFNFLEPTVPKTTAVPTVTVHHHPPQQQNVPAPMDISDAGEAFSKALLNVQDIDANDKDNPQLVSEYVNDIYEYMRSLERKYPVKAHYLEGQEITGKMRSILIDWLCQVHHRFHLLQETLYLTVSIIDRYLQISSVTRSKLQLVGVTAMLIASKYEEMYAPEVADFVYITDNAYSKKEILEMEQNVLRTLNFSFGRPLCLHFLRRNSKAGQVDANKHTLAKYLMELTIIEYEMVQYYPSHVAAAALCLSMKLLDNSRWTETLSHYSSYVEKELMPLMQKLASLVVKAENSKLTAVKTKYSSSKFMKISLIPELKSPTIKDLAAAATVNSS